MAGVRADSEGGASRAGWQARRGRRGEWGVRTEATMTTADAYHLLWSPAKAAHHCPHSKGRGTLPRPRAVGPRLGVDRGLSLPLWVTVPVQRSCGSGQRSPICVSDPPSRVRTAFPWSEHCDTPIPYHVTGLVKLPGPPAACAAATCPGPHPCTQGHSPLHPRAPQSQQGRRGADLPSTASLLRTLSPVSGGQDTSLCTQQVFTHSRTCSTRWAPWTAPWADEKSQGTKK